jgi:uncharacterized protein DUF4128
VRAAVVHPDVRSACRTRLLTLNDLPLRDGPTAEAAAWEGYHFEPVKGEAYFEDALLPVSDDPAALGAIHHDMQYVVTLRYPSGDGTAEIEAMAGKLLELFSPGTGLTYEDTSCLCMKAERRGKIRIETDWVSATVAVRISSYTVN